MKIIILGAGQVGGTLAENLVGEKNEITVVDTNREKLRVLQDKYDLQVVSGHSAHPEVLKQAGAEDAELVVAVTSDDSTNMIACQICYSLFNTVVSMPINRQARFMRPALSNRSDKVITARTINKSTIPRAEPSGQFIAIPNWVATTFATIFE